MQLAEGSTCVFLGGSTWLMSNPRFSMIKTTLGVSRVTYERVSLVELSLWCTAPTSQMTSRRLRSGACVLEHRRAPSAEPTSLDLSVAAPSGMLCLRPGIHKVIRRRRIALQKRIGSMRVDHGPTSTHLMAYRENMFQWSSMT